MAIEETNDIETELCIHDGNSPRDIRKTLLAIALRSISRQFNCANTIHNLHRAASGPSPSLEAAPKIPVHERVMHRKLMKRPSPGAVEICADCVCKLGEHFREGDCNYILVRDLLA